MNFEKKLKYLKLISNIMWGINICLQAIWYGVASAILPLCFFIMLFIERRDNERAVKYYRSLYKKYRKLFNDILQFVERQKNKKEE